MTDSGAYGGPGAWSGPYLKGKMPGVTRPGWDDWAMGIARAVSARGDCTRRQVGAIILDTRRRIVSWGYNGTAPGKPGCLSGACPRGHQGYDSVPDLDPSYDDPSSPGFCIAVHAEINAIIDATPERLVDATLYVTLRPCGPCLKVIGNTRIHRVVYPKVEGATALEAMLV